MGILLAIILGWTSVCLRQDTRLLDTILHPPLPLLRILPILMMVRARPSCMMTGLRMTDGGKIEDTEVMIDMGEVMIDIMIVVEETDTEEAKIGMIEDTVAEKDTGAKVEKDMEVVTEKEARKEVEVILKKNIEDHILETVEKVHQLQIGKKGRMR